MEKQIVNHKCPNCTAPLRFEGGSGEIQCDHCGTSYETSVIEQLYADDVQAAEGADDQPQWDFSMAGSEWSDEEAQNMRAYICPACAAELICDETTAATSCPYCGNPTIIPGQFAGDLRPDYIIPFALDKEAAVAALEKYYKKKKFLPTMFAEKNHIEEIKSVYVPFWLFNGESDASIRYRGTVVTTSRRGDYQITNTDHYRVIREGSIKFEKIPVDGSTKMPDTHMDSIEPFKYDELISFSSVYMPGHLADKYDLNADECNERANKRINNSTVKAFADTAAGYTTLTPEYTDIRLKKGDVKYAMLPVWMLSTKWKDKDFLFAMNGQTGKLIGDLPIDWRKFWAWFGGISAPLMAIFALILF